VLAFAENIEVQKVISAFDRRNTTHKSQFKPNFDFVLTHRYTHYGAVVQQKDLTLCNIFALWDRKKAHLYVYDELIAKNPIISQVTQAIKTKTNFTQYPIDRFLAHPLMFSKEPTEKTVPKLYRKAKIWVKEPLKLDMNGAMALTEQFFTQNRITIHEHCFHVVSQLASWSIDHGKPEKADNGCCIALCLIVSEIEKREEPTPKFTQPKFYQSRKPDLPKYKYQIKGYF
jgi:hypothetical protein